MYFREVEGECECFERKSEFVKRDVLSSIERERKRERSKKF
jgi:hypothetical protein